MGRLQRCFKRHCLREAAGCGSQPACKDGLTQQMEADQTTMNRPDYEALDDIGIPYMRKALVIAELSTADARLAALEEATAALAERLGLKALKCIAFGTPTHLAFSMTRQQAKNHTAARLLLTQGGDLSLDHVPSYR